jgi:hypothetical protein
MRPPNPAVSPARSEVAFEDLDQLVGSVPGVVGHPDRVDPAWHEATAGVAAQEAAPVELLVADHVRDDVAAPAIPCTASAPPTAAA